MLWAATARASDPVLMVVGAEYTTPIHIAVSGIETGLQAFTYDSGPVPPYTGLAADLLALDSHGEDPLHWYAHPNWRPITHPATQQRDDLLGIRAAAGDRWHPDAIGLLNVGIDPTFGDPPASWRKQVALGLVSLYCPLVTPDSLPAFLLEGDFHSPPTAFFATCGEPYTTVWVPENWRSLPALAAKTALFTAIRERRTVGSVGASRFVTLETSPTAISLELSAAIQHLQLWGGGSEPLRTWSNVASASYPLTGSTEPYLFWFAYGDTLTGGAGGWNGSSCSDKHVFFTSPLAATGPGTFSNPFSAAARAGRIPIKVLFHQHSNLSPDAPNGPTYEAVMGQCRSLGIDAVLMTDHLPGNLDDLPTFTAAWDVIPPPNPQSVTATGSGVWNSTIPDAPWPNGNVPHCNDAVTIPDGRTITINCNALCQSLTVGEGTSGVLEFDASVPRALTVTGNVIIRSGASLRTPATGNVTGHAISIGGSLTNDGIFDLYTAGGSAGGELTFVGQTAASFAGTGPVNDLRKLTVNKGTTLTPVLDIHPANFMIRGKRKDTSGFLTLLNGTLRFSGTFPCTTSTFSGNGSYIIKPTCGLWLDDPAFILSGRNGATSVNGRLQIDQGVMEVGTDPNNVFVFTGGSQLKITGGLLQVAGRLVGTGGFFFEQSGGRLEVATAGNLTSSPAFDLGPASTTFTMSGGVIAIVRTSFFAPFDYRVNATNLNLTGGEVRFGTAVTPPSALFRIAGALPNLVIDGTTTPKTAFLIASGPTTRVFQSTTIEAGTSLSLNGATLYQRGAALVNHGTFVSTIGSQLIFEGTTPQTVGGTGTFPAALAQIKLDNPAGVTLTQATNLPVLKLSLVHGVVSESSRLTIGQGGTTPATIEIGAPNGAGTGGALDQSPVWDLGSGGLHLSYYQESAPRLTGYEIPLSRSVAQLTLDNQSGVTVTGGAITIASNLLLTRGVLHTSAESPIELASTVTSPPVGSAASHVEGPLAIQLPAGSSPLVYRFAIGRDGAFRPLTLLGVVTGNLARTVTAEVVPGSHTGTPSPPLELLLPRRGFRVTATAELNPDARVRLAFGPDDGVTAVSAARVAQSDQEQGTFSSLGGLGSGTPGDGTVESIAALTPGLHLFALGLAAPPAHWDGGAGSSRWSDAANWQPDEVPSATTDVQIDAAGPSSIQVDGTFAVRDLVLTGPAEIDADGGTLVVHGDYAQLAGGLHLGRGTLEVRGDFRRDGGPFDAGTGVLIFDGDLDQVVTGRGLTLHDLVLRNGAPEHAKVWAAGDSLADVASLTVERTARLALASPAASAITVHGDLTYAGLPGGANLSFLTLRLAGEDRTLPGPDRSPLEMNVTVLDLAHYTLTESLLLAAGRTLTIGGRLDCGGFTLGGEGNLLLAPTGTLATTTQDPLGLGATVIVSGTRVFTDGIVEYNALGDQTINTTHHPVGAMLYLAGNGPKTLDGPLTLTGNSGPALTKGAVYVRPGSTLVDGGHVLRLTGTPAANIIVEGSYLSTAGGGLCFDQHPIQSSIRAVDGTTFGDLRLNFDASTSRVDLKAIGTQAALTFRNLVFGGEGGAARAGGTLRLSTQGTTPVVVTGDVRIAPSDSTQTGGGFTGLATGTGTITVHGDIITESRNPNQSILAGPGTYSLRMAGSSPQILALGTSATNLFVGATLEIVNPAGVELGGTSPLSYRLGGRLLLLGGNVTTGPHTLSIGPTGQLLRTDGHVVGNLEQYVPAGNSTRRFEVGSNGGYSPVDAVFAQVSPPGYVRAAAVAENHPAHASSGLDPVRSVHRYFQLAPADFGFQHCDLTLHYPPEDIGPGGDPLTFVVRRYAGGNWSACQIGARSPTSIEARALPGLGDFAIGTMPQVTASDVTLSEGNGGTTNAEFEVTISTLIGESVRITYLTADGTAAGGSDFTPILFPDTLTFDPGGTLTRTVQVPVHGDTQPEMDESFFLRLLGDPAVAVIDSLAEATIVNDDGPVLAVSGASVTEGNAGFTTAQFTLTLGSPGPDPVEVTWQTVAGTATAGSDFTPVGPATALFTPGGATTQELPVVVIGDPWAEADEDFLVRLSNAVHATVVVQDGLGVILNDDGTVGVEPPAVVPIQSYLGQVFPNPFAGQAVIPFGLSTRGRTSVRIYDIQGRLVRILVDRDLPAGEQQLTWDARNEHGNPVAAGGYLIRLESGGSTWTRFLIRAR